MHGKSFVADNGDLPPGIAGLPGMVIRVVPFSRIETTGDFSGKVDILDQLGNRVISGDLVPGSGSASSMYFHWNGRNRKGRDVGVGVYMAVIRVTLRDGETQTTRMYLGVKR